MDIRLVNILSVDLEEWFQVDSFSRIISRDQWGALERRVPRQTDSILGLLEAFNTKATFFIVGWIAERYPMVLDRITAAGHEIASHGFLHMTLPELGPKEFRKDLRRSKTVLEDLSGKEVIGFRAPCWSMTRDTDWAYTILEEEGFLYDSSVYPIAIKYGQPEHPRFGHQHGNGLWEFPLSTWRVCGVNIPVGGGFFFRAQPAWFCKLAMRQYRKTRSPFVAYLHPWEIDPGHPRIDAGIKTRIIHYYNISKTASRLTTLLRGSRFTSFENYIHSL